MKTSIEYTIVAVPFHADAATHDELSRKVNEKLTAGYELLGAPFLMGIRSILHTDYKSTCTKLVSFGFDIAG
jgi:hypothetical protein